MCQSVGKYTNNLLSTVPSFLFCQYISAIYPYQQFVVCPYQQFVICNLSLSTIVLIYNYPYPQFVLDSPICSYLQFVLICNLPLILQFRLLSIICNLSLIPLFHLLSYFIQFRLLSCFHPISCSIQFRLLYAIIVFLSNFVSYPISSIVCYSFAALHHCIFTLSLSLIISYNL